MNYQELLKFITENQHNDLNDLKDYYDKTYAKLHELNKKIDRTSLYLIVVVLLYFLLARSSVEKFSIGPFEIKDITIISQLLPVLFAYFLFDLVITSNHKTEVYTTVKALFLSFYKQNITIADFDKNRNNFFTRVLLPFSFTTDLSRLFSGKTPIAVGCAGIIIALPTLALYLLPFYFEYYMLRDIYQRYYELPIAKVSFYLTIYINAVIVFYFVKVTITNYQDQKAQNLI